MEREAFMHEMIAIKEGQWCFTVSVPACALSGVAHPLLKATSEEHGEPLEVVETAGRRATSVQLHTFLDCGRRRASPSSSSTRRRAISCTHPPAPRTDKACVVMLCV